MEFYTFDADTLNDKLKKLSNRSRIIFGASCSERLLPNYKKFVEIERWGDFEFLEFATDEIWQIALNNVMDKSKIEFLMEKCIKITPDSDDFNSIYTSFAIDAGGAVYETLNYCFDNDLKHLVDVASFARDTVDMYIQERDNMDYSDNEFELKILKDPLMIRELKRQLADIEMLSKESIITPKFITEFKLSIKGKNNID